MCVPTVFFFSKSTYICPLKRKFLAIITECINFTNVLASIFTYRFLEICQLVLYIFRTILLSVCASEATNLFLTEGKLAIVQMPVLGFQYFNSQHKNLETGRKRREGKNQVKCGVIKRMGLEKNTHGFNNKIRIYVEDKVRRGFTQNHF